MPAGGRPARRRLSLLNTQSILGQQLTGLLNIVQQLVNTPALLGL